MDNKAENYRILLVDDNPIELKSFELFFEDYNVVTCQDPEVAIEKIYNQAFDVILIDIYMNKINGVKIFKHIKKSEINKDAYTIAYTGISDKIVHEIITELGFNDIIEKPANLSLLELKLKNIVKNNSQKSKPHHDNLIEDPENFNFLIQGKSLDLTYKEYEILKILMDKKGEIVSHKEIYHALYGDEQRSGNIIKSHMKNLRNKISDVSNEKEYIKTIPLKGYCLIF